MILLASNGLSSPSLMEAAGRYVRPGKAALVVTADNVYKEKRCQVICLNDGEGGILRGGAPAVIRA